MMITCHDGLLKPKGVLDDIVNSDVDTTLTHSKTNSFSALTHSKTSFDNACMFVTLILLV